MQPNETEEQVLDKQLDDICDGLREAVDREVETLQQEGFPIYVSDNGRVVDLQQQTPHRKSTPGSLSCSLRPSVPKGPLRGPPYTGC